MVIIEDRGVRTPIFPPDWICQGLKCKNKKKWSPKK
jgi:hypothetical protein